jgi:tRNA nucleotidyltransferase (CCA-adding enzyme)
MERLLAPETRSLLKSVGEVASRLEMPLYLVGGPVRDLLLDRPPDDLDLVVEGDAPTLASEVSRETGGETLSHSRFGTATLRVDDLRLDIATARTETYSRPGALPEVQAGTLRQDLIRRDFSINAMAVSLSGEETGQLVDMFGGNDDLSNGLVRVLHNRSFIDDPTRILRGIRYEQRLGFRFGENTLRLLREALERGSLSTVTGDRLRHELELMLEEPEPLKSLLRARGLEVFPHLYPTLGDTPYLPKLEGQPIDEPLIYLAALAYGLHPVHRPGFVYRLNMPSKWERVVADAVTLHSLESQLTHEDMPPLELCCLLDPLSPVSLRTGLLLADEGSVKRTLERYLNELRYVKPLLNGDDLLLLGIPEGPLIGEALAMLRQARLEGRTATRHDEVALAREFINSRDIGNN